MRKHKQVNIRKYGPAYVYAFARAFTLAQRAKKPKTQVNGKSMSKYVIFFFLSLVTGYATKYLLYTDHLSYNDEHIFTEDIVGKRHYIIKERGRRFGFDLLDPETAPPEIHEQVMHGYRIFIQTQQYAANYVGNKLTCNNCHFAGGNTLGGKNGGISLVGVVSTYPQYAERMKKVITLKERINNCFMRSMNGKPLPEDSSDINDIVAYLTWISQEVIRIGNLPWLGLPVLKSSHKPDAIQGKVVYNNNCSICHDSDGSGTTGVPPLWGPGSFNDGAGMHMIKKLSSFVYYNMPYHQPTLTEEEALDVAAFVITRPRPKFIDKSSKVESVPNNR